MGKIKKPDGALIDDRRSNGARIKLDGGDWIRIVFVTFGFVVAGVNIQFRVNDHTQVLAEQKEELKLNWEMGRDNRKDIDNMKERIGRIDTNVQRLIERK